MNRFIVCLLLCAIVAGASATSYSDCGSSHGKVSAVTVEGCPDGQDTCILKKGSQAVISIQFKSQTDSKSLKMVCHGVIHHVPIPFPFPQPDACKTGVACPVKSGQTYTYSSKLPVKKSYPSLDVTVRMELKGEDGEDLVCVEIPIQIAD